MTTKTQDGPITVYICQGTGCVASGADPTLAALEQTLSEQMKDHNLTVDFTGCHGFCQQGPIVVIEPEGVFYTCVKAGDVPEIAEAIKEGRLVDRLLYRDPVTKEPVPHYKDIKFYARQHRIVLRNCGRINPERIDDYLARGGYQALRKVLFEMKPEAVIAEMKKSGLRGRGGAGFPTGQKWDFCRQAPGTEKYIICNADEGDPGAFMDRSTMEGDPHTVIEGMLIGAYAIGSSEGYVYCRAEYPLAIRRLKVAMAQAEERGFIGNNIMGSPFSFRLHIKEGAGAFVCGEETALMASIEGRRGMPRPRPPFPAQAGLWGRPTNINNVETWANVPVIIAQGADWYASIGTEKSKGTKVFALTGKVANCGLVEVPMGIPLRDIIYEIGGGIPDGKKFKAAQTGGPSGGCLPAELLDLPVDYESLTRVGSIMGSGGMVVMDEETCMVDVSRFFLSFTQSESCGKCVPCRVGTRHMLEILERITRGEGRPGDIELLQQIGQTVQTGSLCGLGQTAPNPVISTLRYFREEYEAHINEKRCPALQCKALINYFILPDKCMACGICKRACPVAAIEGDKKIVHVIDQEKCIKCGTCKDVCPARFAAVTRLSGVPVPEVGVQEVRREPKAAATASASS